MDQRYLILNPMYNIYHLPILYQKGFSDEILSIQTFYEQQWLERGFNIKYVKFICEYREQYIEPDIEIEFDGYRSFKLR